MGLISDSVFRHVPVRATLESLAQIFSAYPEPNFRVHLWDGTTWGATHDPRFTLVVKHPDVLKTMFVSPNELALGECYICDELDIEGDIEAAVEMGDYLIAQERPILPASLRFASMVGKLPHRHTAWDAKQQNNGSQELHSRERDRRAISYHYDLPPDFFALWLDKRQIYSCAYFEDHDCDLDTAQRGKLDYLCRKLRLGQGERLLDIGCGWGGMLIHAATHYGVQALGITLSVRQAEVARQRIREHGLNDRCRVEVCDYRDLELSEQFDKISSIGMFEHVGEVQLPEYFSRVRRLLRSGGVFINTGISASASYQRPGPSFIDNYVFPDGELVPISRSLHAAEACDLEVRDIESLREHYVLTLRHWLRRLEAHEEQAIKLTDQMTYRIWRLYMGATAHAFSTGRINVYHALFVKTTSGVSGLPLTRADWYGSRTDASEHQ
jgi:cyclopropane-fatty-acyl-phospholipid synthase